MKPQSSNALNQQMASLLTRKCQDAESLHVGERVTIVSYPTTNRATIIWRLSIEYPEFIHQKIDVEAVVGAVVPF